jgi:uncharacterized coiled-coil protein SlyX
MTTDTPPNSNNDAITQAAVIIAHALKEAEVMITADRDARANSVPPEVLETMERFSDILARLVDHTESLAARMSDLTEAVANLTEAQAAQPAVEVAKPHLPDLEPAFAAGGEGIDVTIAAVPGFQGLMEIQRALVRLPQVQSAAVRRYQDDEAAIQLVLSQPMTASAIAEGVTAGTGKRIFVDEASPDALRLRLRFLNGA